MQRRYWSVEEDQTLKIIVASMPQINWTLISHRMMSTLSGCQRNAKQCRERWLNQLNHSCSQDIPWTSSEDKIILQQYLKLYKNQKNKWIVISQKIGIESSVGDKKFERTPNQIKNRFYSVVRKGIRRINNQLGRPIMPEEIRLLKPIVTSKMLQRLNQTQCHQFLQILYNMASDFPQLSQYSQEINKEILQKILANVIEISREQQKIKKQSNPQKYNKKCPLKRRKSSLSTNQQLQNLKKSSSSSSNYYEKVQQIKIERDFIDIYLRDFVQESVSLQFEEIDFGV